MKGMSIKAVLPYCLAQYLGRTGLWRVPCDSASEEVSSDEIDSGRGGCLADLRSWKDDGAVLVWVALLVWAQQEDAQGVEGSGSGGQIGCCQ